MALKQMDKEMLEERGRLESEYVIEAEITPLFLNAFQHFALQGSPLQADCLLIRQTLTFCAVCLV